MEGGASFPSPGPGGTLASAVKMLTQSHKARGSSDGYATGLITVVLERTDFPRDDVHLTRSRAWLIRNQDKTEGSWRSYSLNNARDPSSGTGLFMSEAATAFAVLALSDSNKP